MHTRISGVADHLADDDEHALQIVRRHRRRRSAAEGTAPPWERVPAEPPALDPAELYGVVPADLRKPYDVREVIARIVDGSRFHEFKERYGTTLVCGFAHIHGYPVGILANNGILFSESALKGAHFIELCDQRRDPAASSCRTSPASWSGATTRPAGSPSTARRWSPRSSTARGAEVHGDHRRLVRRRQLRHVRPRVLAALPVDVAERAHQRDGRRAGRDGDDDGRPGRGRRARCASSTSARAIPYYATARLWDDGVIDPPDTRDVLGLALSACANAPLEDVRYGVFRM